jgi:hypothetical protein
MRVIIRHRGSGFYYAGKGRWVGDPWSAQEFPSVELAGQVVLQYNFPDTAVVLRYEEPLCELALTPALASQHAERVL